MTAPFADAVRALPQIRLSRKSGISLTLTALGARMTELWVPDRAGRLADVVLGHDRPEDYLTPHGYIGATCGRYGNRIAGGKFMLDGVEVALDQNEGANHLHGGGSGFDGKIWEIAKQTEDQVSFALTSPDGDMGYPGQLQALCTYRLLGHHGLVIELTAISSAPTVVNLVNHAYYTMAGQGAGDVLGQSLKLHADNYTPVDAANIPTGEVRLVAATPFDFRQARPIGQVLPGPGGFDHNFCLSGPLGPTEAGPLRPAADLLDPASGRSLRLWTDQPGVQVYTGGHFDGSQPGKLGARYGKFAGVALETQVFPDSPNRLQFPPARLDPGETYRHMMYLDLTPAMT